MSGSLSRLAHRDLAGFAGLTAAEDRAAAEAAFGPSEPGDDGLGPLMGALTPFRRYPPTPVGPYGLTVWFAADDRLLLVDVPSPALDAADLLPLGEPEYVAPSRLAPLHDQMVWASRGLAAHVSTVGGAVRALYAFAPRSVADYVAWLGAAEGPRRERRVPP